MARTKFLAGCAGLLILCAPSLSSSQQFYDGALGARLLEPNHGQVRFALSEPAYVAVFEVIPGVGATLVYPWNRADTRRQFGAGVHGGHVSPALSRRLAYTTQSYRTYGPTYLYLIASESPLKLAPYVGSVSGLRTALGYAAFTSMNAPAIFNSLDMLVVPNRETARWTTDVYVLWSPPPATRHAVVYNVITCRDGRSVVVPLGYVPKGCLESKVVGVIPVPRDTTKPGHRNPPQQALKERKASRSAGAPQSVSEAGRSPLAGGRTAGRVVSGSRAGESAGRVTNTPRASEGRVRSEPAAASVRATAPPRARETPAAPVREAPATARSSGGRGSAGDGSGSGGSEPQ